MKAERYIVERCCELQDETMAGIIGIIAKNTERYYKMEEAIRSETEYLYETFRDTNPECREPNTKRRGSGLGKAKSRSASREPVQRNFSPPPKGHPSIQSVISAVPKLKLKGSWNRDPADDLPEASDAEMTVPPPFGGSLLTKSLSAHRQSAAQATQGSSRVAEESLSQEFGQTLRLDKTKDQRAVAMSHVFSILDEQMAKAPVKDGKDAIQRARDGETTRQPVTEERMNEITSIPASVIGGYGSDDEPSSEADELERAARAAPPAPPADDDRQSSL
jgi:hypothetical protein